VTLLSQVFALIVAAVLLAWRARARGALSSARSMAVAAVIAVLTFASLATLWGTWQGFRNERRANAAVPAADVALKGGYAAGANVAFVEWLNGNLPAGDRYFITTNGSDEATYQWLTYRLFPRVAVGNPEQARWVVFLKVTPAASEFKPRDFSRVIEFAPDMVLAERRG
jgi:hypothetical protein